MKNQKVQIYFLLILFILLATALVSVFLGQSFQGVKEIIGVLAGKAGSSAASSIIFHLRLPRIITAIFIGMGLAASGAVFQGILRNPLAEPYTLGISGGAALGVSLAVLVGIKFGISSTLSAFLGSLAVAAALMAFAAKNRFSNHSLILGGLILGFICSSAVLFLFSAFKPEQMQSTMMWLLGDISGIKGSLIWIPVLTAIIGIFFLSYFGRDLDAMSLGEEKSLTLGINPVQIKLLLFILASFIVAICVSFCGVIGFVGLIVPHVVRHFIGSHHRPLIILSALLGGAFLCACDTIARTAFVPVEVPVGVITGFFGGIFFLSVLYFKKKPF